MAFGRTQADLVPEAAVDVADLVRRAKQQERGAFGELYRLSVVPVYRYLSARVGAESEAEDLTQEVFLAALSGIQGLRAEDEAGLLAWLFQIARHKLADHLRRHYRRPALPLAEAAEVASALPGPEDLAARQLEGEELREALAALTAEQREVVMAKYVLGYDNARTARLVGKNVNAVNQLHHRALASLHRLLAGKPR